MQRMILHSDLNNFFASVECRIDPSIADKPVAVAGDEAERHGISVHYDASAWVDAYRDG